jgi:chemotaxis receptor (MCP) glutamine deamidase CheD
VRPAAVRADKAIQAGEVHASATHEVIRTLLGSCVAVCLYDPQRRIGGMNHFMLPHGDSAAHAPAYFGIHAMELLVNAMMKLGADRSRFVAKVFGATELRADSGIAGNNAAFALEYLESEGIPIVARKVGGHLPLAVHFDTQSGVARVREVPRTKTAPTVEVEEHAMQESVRIAVAEDVTFFEAAS